MFTIEIATDSGYFVDFEAEEDKFGIEIVDDDESEDDKSNTSDLIDDSYSEPAPERPVWHYTSFFQCTYITKLLGGLPKPSKFVERIKQKIPAGGALDRAFRNAYDSQEDIEQLMVCKKRLGV